MYVYVYKTSRNVFRFLKPHGIFAVSVEMIEHILAVLGITKWVGVRVLSYLLPAVDSNIHYRKYFWSIT